MSRKPLSATFAIALLGLTACNKTTSEHDPRPAGLDKGPVVAVVNNQNIHEAAVKAFAAGRAGEQGDLSKQDRERLMTDIVNMELLSQKAHAEKLDQQQDVAAQLLAQYYTILARAAVQDYLQKNPVSEADLKQAYEEWSKQMPDTEYKAKHILVKDENVAKSIIEKLNNGGNFEQLAKENSIDPSSAKGGDLGWFNLQQMTPAFAEAVSKLKPGEYTKQPVKTEFGWHVIMLDETRKTQAPAMNEVEGELRGMVQSRKIRAFIDDLRKNGNVKINEEALQAISLKSTEPGTPATPAPEAGNGASGQAPAAGNGAPGQSAPGGQ